MKGFIIGFRINIQPYLQHRCHLITGFYICRNTTEDLVQFGMKRGSAGPIPLTVPNFSSSSFSSSRFSRSCSFSSRSFFSRSSRSSCSSFFSSSSFSSSCFFSSSRNSYSSNNRSSSTDFRQKVKTSLSNGVFSSQISLFGPTYSFNNGPRNLLLLF